MDDPALRKALWPSQIKSPMGQGKFGPHRLQTPLLILFSSYAFSCFREMSPLRRQSTTFLQSSLTEELNSESFWTDGVVHSALYEDTLRLLEGAATPLEGSPALPTNHLLPSFDDDQLGPPSASSPNVERVNVVDFTSDVCPMPFGVRPDDLYATFSLSPSLSTITTDCISLHIV